MRLLDPLLVHGKRQADFVRLRTMVHGLFFISMNSANRALRIRGSDGHMIMLLPALQVADGMLRAHDS